MSTDPRDDQSHQQTHGGEFDSAMEEVLEGTQADEPMAGNQPLDRDQRVAQAEQQVLRAHAELENFRKRMQRDAEQQLKYANLPLMRELLEIVDNLNRAMDSASRATDSQEALLSGVKMVNQQLASVLSKFGCKPVEALGNPFDPNVHEAIAQAPSQEHAAGTVAQEIGVGYTLHDRVVRPSSVIVSTGPAKPTAPTNP